MKIELNPKEVNQAIINYLLKRELAKEDQLANINYNIDVHWGKGYFKGVIVEVVDKAK